jgi:flagellar basal body-associated protein FliL
MVKKKKIAEKEGKEKEQKIENKRPLILRVFFGFFKLIAKFLLIILIIIAVLIILALIAVFLLYNFFTIKTADLCVGNDIEMLNISCQSNSDCISNVFESIKTGGREAESTTGKNIGEGIDIIQGLLKNILKEAAVCSNNSCQIKRVRGITEAFQNEKIECLENEQKTSIKITPSMIFPPKDLMNIIKEFVYTGKIEMPVI